MNELSLEWIDKAEADFATALRERRVSYQQCHRTQAAAAKPTQLNDFVIKLQVRP